MSKSHSIERRYRPQKYLWRHIQHSMEWQIPTFLMKKWRRMQKGRFYSRQVNLVSKTPCFTHGPDQNSVPVCKNPTFTHGKLAPCVKRPLLLTASESRVWNPVFYTRPWQKWSCDSFHLLRAIPPSVAIGHRSASGAIFDAQWNDKIPLSSWKNEVPVFEMACFTHGK